MSSRIKNLFRRIFVKRSVDDSVRVKYCAFFGGELAEKADDYIENEYMPKSRWTWDRKDLWDKPWQELESIGAEIRKGIVENATPYYMVAVNEFFRKQQLPFRTATQIELEEIIKHNLLPIAGTTNVTSALILVSRRSWKEGGLAPKLISENPRIK